MAHKSRYATVCRLTRLLGFLRDIPNFPPNVARLPLSREPGVARPLPLCSVRAYVTLIENLFFIFHLDELGNILFLYL